MSGIAAVILAGGRSSRMGGGDKTLVEIAGKPMLAHVLVRLARQNVLVAINANGDPARFDAFGMPVLADSTQSYDGPLAGILAAMQWAHSQGFDRVLTLSGDTPFFPDNMVSRLFQAGSSTMIAVASSRGRLHPTFALWPNSISSDLDKQLAGGMRRVVDFIGQHPSVEVAFPDIDVNGETIDPFFNVNTPQDLADARRIANKHRP